MVTTLNKDTWQSLCPAQPVVGHIFTSNRGMIRGEKSRRKHIQTRKSVRGFYKLLACICLSLLSACSQAEAKPCGDGVPRHSLHSYTNRTRSIAGHMGKYWFAVSRQYQFTEAVYKGFDIWRKEIYGNNPKVSAFNSELNHFAVMIRRNNFKPIESDADKESVNHFEHNQKTTPLDQRWMLIGFQYMGKVEQERNPGKEPIKGQCGSLIEGWDWYSSKYYGQLIDDKKRSGALATTLQPVRQIQSQASGTRCFFLKTT